MARNTFTGFILSGGQGAGLWPASRKLLPKQFVNLVGEETLFESTAKRMLTLLDPDRLWVVAGKDQIGAAGHKFLKDYQLLLEPVARNTAAAVSLAAAYALDHVSDDPIFVVPSDQIIQDLPELNLVLEEASKAAQKGNFVVFGLDATQPSTHCGYIKVKNAQDGHNALDVVSFDEKPDTTQAKKYIKEGNVYWNSGMLFAMPSLILEAVKQHVPELYDVLDLIRTDWSGDVPVADAINRHYAKMPRIQFERAVFEHVDNMNVIPCNLGWEDIGTWDSVYDVMAKDVNGNAVKGEFQSIDSKNSLFFSGKRMITGIGVEDLLVVDTDDAILIAKRGESDKVENMVEKISKLGGEHHLVHRTAYRPWGNYTVLEDGYQGFKIKRIEVSPGGKLSLQSHQHRSEHWVIVSGTATVTCDGTEKMLRPNESTYIPAGTVHRLENKGRIPVQLVEVQVGEYLGEDDIERYEDVYGRT